ncbi:MAG TPA: hypothetical protein VF331_25930 [Polyangiales bacterium]
MSERCRALACALVTIALWAAAGPAAVVRAQPPAALPPERPLAAAMQVEPGATCLDLQRLALRVARWRERDTVDARIRVRVQGDAHSSTQVSFSVTVEGGAHAERTISDAPVDCDQLHSAVALSIALSIDATLTAGNPSDPVVEIPVPAEPPASTAHAPGIQLTPDLPTYEQRRRPDSHTEDSRSSPPHLELGVYGGATTGLLTDTSLALAPRLSFAPNAWFSVAVAGLASTLADQIIPQTPGHFDLRLLAAGADVCAGHEVVESLQLQACLGVRAGVLRATGTGYPRAMDGTEPWLASALSAQARVWLASWAAIGVAVEGLAPFARHVILIRGVLGAPDRSRLLPAIGLATTIGPVFRFF